MKIFEKYYRILELPTDSTDVDIKAAYRRLAKLYHPDKSGNQTSRHKFIDVNEAYEVLMNRDAYVRDAVIRYQKRKEAREILQRKYGRDYAAGARERAMGNADLRFREFEKSPIYRTALVINSAANYVFVGIGVVMILSPFVGYYREVVYGRPDGKEAEFHIFPIFLGILFLYGLWYFLIKNKDS
ncbi:J domain-containing protein [Cryomorpha ignava]|uniref:J domain-containing protein n=1 Tax=Cryomorpha ignava TaxID=101383 RepID=A0A7K3WQA4_9FLAO|nr:J domain-containing protein [Cryomorpha ignava]NEN23668.1 J domain-containing protein [Cryomorpha ignava]